MYREKRVASSTPDAHNSAALAAVNALLAQGRQMGELEGVLQGLDRTLRILDNARAEVEAERVKVINEITASQQRAAAADNPNPDLSLPVDQLGLNPRTRNFLQRNSILTVGDLVERSENDLRDIRGFGEASVNDARKQLARIGLSLKGDA